jgi:hypothetical protein
MCTQMSLTQVSWSLLTDQILVPYDPNTDCSYDVGYKPNIRTSLLITKSSVTKYIPLRPWTSSRISRLIHSFIHCVCVCARAFVWGRESYQTDSCPNSSFKYDLSLEWVIRKRKYRKIHNEELNHLYSLSSIVRVGKSRRMRRVEHVVCTVEVKNAYKSSIGKPQRQKPAGWLRWGSSIKMTQKWDVGVWTRFILIRPQWRALVNTVMKLRDP